MTATLRLALCQMNAHVGALSANAAKARSAYAAAVAGGAQLAVLPELFLTGYPPEDLLLLTDFVNAVAREMDALAADIGDVPLVIGAPRRHGAHLLNAAWVLQRGRVVATQSKTLLPNYAVFDERRYFVPAPSYTLCDVGPVRVGLTVCEDLWWPGDPGARLCGAGAQLLLNLSASPYHRGKQALRRAVFAARARELGVPVAMCNLVGGQDELVFDGQSVVIGADGAVGMQAPAFVETVAFCDVDAAPRPRRRAAQVSRVRLSAPAAVGTDTVAANLCASDLEPVHEVVEALTLGLRDYVGKNGFPSVVIGSSGGIDSALVATLAVRALGPARVVTVSMPSRFSSDGTRNDATALAAALRVRHHELSIEPMFAATLDTIAPALGAYAQLGLTAENVQARIRGLLLMAFSNREGHLLLATGNKSEYSMGYATLYGDMAGGFAVIKDLTKTWVYRCARWLQDREGFALPESLFTRAPSAELRPDQRDEDSLPPYAQLDPVLEGYVERNEGYEALVSQGHDEQVVRRVIAAVDRNEYKRRQAPPGIRVTERAFGKDRRMPITNGFSS